MDKENPFSSPMPQYDTEQNSLAFEDQLDSANSFFALARPIFLAWEKLRLIYIGILVVCTLLAAAVNSSLLNTFDFWAAAIFGAIVTNLCFFAGPIVESYLTWLKINAARLRLPLFMLGTILSCAVATTAVFKLASAVAN
ncbi:MAG: hypothetical protein AB8B55_15215 [Mariniblastus sp.]